MLSASTVENVIAVIPDETGSQRLVFLARGNDSALPIVLRQESFSRDVGWFTQSQIEISRAQMIMLRSSLGASGTACGMACTVGPGTRPKTVGGMHEYEEPAIFSLEKKRQASRVLAS